jgi:hypothetical protein
VTDQPIGPILDGLGIQIDLEGELVETALVITKLVTDDGQVLLGLYGPDSLSWLEKLGLIEAAKNRITSTPWRDADE